MNNDQALVPRSTLKYEPAGTVTLALKPAPPLSPNGKSKIEATPLPPLTDELVKSILKGRGLRGWLRAFRVAGVLNLLSLYLFLDTYDVRANFNQRTVARLREAARDQGPRAKFKAWLRALNGRVLDKFIRVVRLLVFPDLNKRKVIGTRNLNVEFYAHGPFFLSAVGDVLLKQLRGGSIARQGVDVDHNVDPVLYSGILRVNPRRERRCEQNLQGEYPEYRPPCHFQFRWNQHFLSPL